MQIITDYDFQYSVDRQEQIDDFNRCLSRIQKSSYSKSLLEWFGGPGIGKTHLIGLLQNECEQLGVPYVLTDFKRGPIKASDYEKTPVLLVENIASSLTKQVCNNLSLDWLNVVAAFNNESSLPKNPVQAYYKLSRHERLYNRPVWLIKWRDTVAMFLELVRAVTMTTNGQIQPTLLFFDETEYASSRLINWIEEWIINPILRQQGCAVVWTTRGPISRWKRPEVRQKLISQQLHPFSPVNMRLQLQARNIDLPQELFNRVHQVTVGHPFAGDLTAQRIHQWQVAGETVTADYIWDRRSVLLWEIFGEFIENYAFAGLDEDEKIALQLVALVRVFDTKMLQALLEKHSDKQLSYEDTQDLLNRLKRTQLLVWEKGHTLDPNLRHLIRNYYLTNEPHIFTAVNQTALAMNQSWLNKPVDNMNLFVIEELYHHASLQEVGQPVNIKEAFQKRLNDYDYRWNDLEIRISTLARLAGELDADKELTQLTDEHSITTLVGIVQNKISGSEKV